MTIITKEYVKYIIPISSMVIYRIKCPSSHIENVLMFYYQWNFYYTLIENESSVYNIGTKHL